MYDIKRRKEISGMTVEDIISELATLPRDAVVICCGDDNVWIHVEQDNSVVCINTESLADCYDSERRDKAEKFLAMLKRKIYNWDEWFCFTVCDVKNLSRSDMDDLILYTKHFIEYGYFKGLREPRGSVAEVLKRAGVIDDQI